MSIKDTYNLDELDKKSIIYELLERELQFKEALIYDSVCVFEVNLTTDTFESMLNKDNEMMGEQLGFLGLSFPCSYSELKEKCDQFVYWSRFDEKNNPTRENLINRFENDDRCITYQFWIKLFDGRRHFMKTLYLLTKDAQTGDINALIVIKDKTEEKRNDEKRDRELFIASYIDPCTGGWNRTYFDREAEKKIKAGEPGQYTFVTCDISAFALINDMVGIEVGNVLLSHVYKSLDKCIKSEDLICRHTNDIFNILVSNDTLKIYDKKHWSTLIELLCDLRNVPGLEAMHEKNIDHIRVKFGAYKIMDPNESIILIRDKANSAKKSEFVEQVSPHVTLGLYSSFEMKKKEKEYNISRKMEKALASGEFEAWLQPKLNLKNGCITGAEALVRWNDSEVGLIPPMEFIPVMEKNGFVTEVDMYVFEQCCRALRNWIDKGYNPIRISSNFSRLHLQNENFVEDLLEITRKYDVSPCYLEIEITETIVFSDIKQAKRIDNQLKNAGFLFSIDDFGSGYSSLNMLSELNVDIIKLDRSFFGDSFFPDANRQYVIESLIELGQNLGTEVIVEGVENEAQLQFLCRSGCDMAQGYAISKPICLKEFEEKYVAEEYCWAGIKELANYLHIKSENERLVYENFNAIETQSALSGIGRFVCYFDIASRTLTIPESYSKRYSIPIVINDISNIKDKDLERFLGQSETSYDEFRAFFNEIAEGKTPNGEAEFQIYASEEKYYWEHIVYALVYGEDQKPLHAVIIVDDTTERHVRELEEKYSNVLVADALKRAETANQVKHDFLTRMSHDIRTPLNGIIGMTEIAKKKKDDPEQILNCLEKINVSSNRLVGIVNSILDVKYFDADSFVKSTEIIDSRVLFNDLMGYASALASDNNIEFKFLSMPNEHPLIYADAVHFRQVLVNIINNAIKYTPSGGLVSIEESNQFNEDTEMTTITYAISDTGIGMSKEFLRDVYEPFSRERLTKQTDFDGVGLGLTIAKQLVDFMNGDIKIESQLDKGTTVIVSVAFKTVDSEKKYEIQDSDASKDISGMKILIAEDNELNLEIITTILEENNATFVTAINGQEAVDRFKESQINSFDAILMDIMMPEMDGLEATRVIRALDREDAKTVPIIAMTANIFAEDVNSSFDAGMNEHLSKPVEIENLLSRLHYYYKK